MIMLASSTSTASIVSHTFFRISDRFHWRGHVGYSSGYCLDTYQHMAIKEINSQVKLMNKQNADLQHIRGQLAYMTPENFNVHFKTLPYYKE